MPSPKDPNKYLGPNVYTGVVVRRNRSPTLADYRQPETGQNYEIATLWQVTKDPTTGTEGDMWILSKIIANQGYWLKITSGVIPSGGILTLSDTANALVYPTIGGNVQLEGGAGITITSVPLSNKLTFALSGGGTAIDSIQVQAATAPGVNPVTSNGAGLISISGAVVAAHSVPLETRTRALNSLNVEAQIASLVSPTPADTNSVGLACFNTNQFQLDATSGMVSLKGSTVDGPVLGINVDAHTAPGTDPVPPDGSGLITVTGAQVATGTVGTNVIRTNSLAANTYTIEIQRSTAVAATDVTKNGVCHFNTGQFTVDANGFVTCTIPPGGGIWTFIETKTLAAATTATFNTSLTSYTELMFTFYNLAKGGGVGQIYFTVSTDNGSTTVTGLRSDQVAVPSVSNLFYMIITAGAGDFSGYLNIQNVTGTTPKVANGWNGISGFGQNETYSVIPSGAVLNWVQFVVDAGVTMTGDINLFGR